MIHWTTDEIAPHDRFAHWREVRARNIYGVTAELAPKERLGFRGAFSVLEIGGAAVLGEMRASAYEVTRGPADIARASSDSLCLYEQTGGACWFATDGGEFIVREGELALSHSDLPYRTRPVTPLGYHLRLVKIPFAECKVFAASPGELVARKLPAQAGIGALFAAYFRSYIAQAPHLSGHEAQTATQTLVQLAFLARGLVVAREEPARDAVRAARLERARQIVETHLCRPDLRPAMVSAALAISVRQLHLLFAPTGVSFARYVLARRLERARMLLALNHRRSVLDIALDCGIDSPSVFYRGFRSAYGMSPTDYRRSLCAPSEKG
ncbi:MAG: AraC family transcriptional regulator [Pseudomonadota bacterium]